MFDWDGFRDGRIAVHCETYEETDSFLELMREHGLFNRKERSIRYFASKHRYPVTIRGVDGYCYDEAPDWYIKDGGFGVESVVLDHNVIDDRNYNFNESDFLSLL